MKTRRWINEGLTVAGYGLVVLVALPVVAILLVALRPVVLAAMVGAMLVGLGMWLASTRFRDWLMAEAEDEVTYKGLRLATDVAVHPGHAWARLAGGTAWVGADDLAQAALGPVEHVEALPAGRHVVQGERLFRLGRGARTVELRAPLTGTVVKQNDTLAREPDLVNRDPFHRGWVVMLRPGPEPDARRRGLFRGHEARAWFRGEVDRLLSTALAEGTATPALADGGLLAGDFYRRIDDEAWRRVTGTLFASVEPAAHAGPAGC